MTTIQPLRPYMKFIDDQGVLTKEGYDFLFNLYNRVSGGSTGVDANTLEGKTWESPGTIGVTSSSTGKFTTILTTGQYTNTVGIGTPPFIITSTTNIPNLNASSLNGATFAAPGTIGGGTPGTGTFIGLTATGTVSLSPANLNVSLSPTGTGIVTINPAGTGTINNMSIGATTQSTIKGTTVTATGAFGCNGTTAQTAFASGGAAPAGGVGAAAGGWDTAAHRDSAITLLNNIRDALVANGIMS